MLVYRVCSKVEAVVRSANPGFHATLVPEHWRRILNGHMKEQGLGIRYTYTLLLEIPDQAAIGNEPLPGMEYRLDNPSQVIVRGIAGPAWPLPAWVPQPKREVDWEPTSTRWSTSVCRWQPKKG